MEISSESLKQLVSQNAEVIKAGLAQLEFNYEREDEDEASVFSFQVELKNCEVSVQVVVLSHTYIVSSRLPLRFEDSKNLQVIELCNALNGDEILITYIADKQRRLISARFGSLCTSQSTAELFAMNMGWLLTQIEESFPRFAAITVAEPVVENSLPNS